MNKVLKVFLTVLGIIIAANIFFLDYYLFFKKNDKTILPQESPKEDLLNNKKDDVEPFSCSSACEEEITQKIKEEVEKISLPTGAVVYKTPTITSIPQKSTSANSIYIPLATEGASTSTVFTDVVPSEFYFDLSDYPGAREVRLQAYLLSSNNDLVYARLYDNTNKRGVDNSDLQTQTSSFTRVESGPMSIWRGNNKYTIQLRSVNGTLVQFKEAKLKISY